ncbi:LLM class flavin-dependent oxidoreductase [Rhodococcus baikonurensis]
MSRLRFGYFMAPFHVPGRNPTAALQRDLELVEHLDRLGYDEAWFGEHHSAGSEIIASPEIMIAAASQRAPRIRFGTGVTSLSYHNPLWAADRIMQLDHLTQGRTIFGVGPGSLPTDSAMIGLNPTDTRELLQENLDIVVRLLRGETVSAKTRTHELYDAKLQLAPYSENGIEITVAAVASRPVLAWPVRTVSACSPSNSVVRRRFRRLGAPLECDGGARGGQRDDGGSSAVVSCRAFPCRRNRGGSTQAGRIRHRGVVRLFPARGGLPQMAVSGARLSEMIDFINEAGIGVIGTPEQARRQVQRLWDQSGGFGCMLQMGHDWANPQDTRRSAELFAQEVFPHFQGQAQATLDAAAHARAVREGHAKAQLDAVDHMTKKYAQELADKG